MTEQRRDSAKPTPKSSKLSAEEIIRGKEGDGPIPGTEAWARERGLG
jgi:hypothetical protein